MHYMSLFSIVATQAKYFKLHRMYFLSAGDLKNIFLNSTDKMLFDVTKQVSVKVEINKKIRQWSFLQSYREYY